ncbi:MAG: 3-isopropylmalate dehydratase small subunit [Bacteroidota bacterium]
MNHFPPFTSRVIPLLTNDIDTDQIIPARFLKATDKSGMGNHLFADWSHNPDGSLNPTFALNKSENQSSKILLTGNNFGCGSSREHAAWALRGFGIQAVISTSFADIFRANALKNGLLPITVDAATHRRLCMMVEETPEMELTVDLATSTVTLPGNEAVQFPIDGFSKACLLNGVDELGYLLSFESRISEYETRGSS